MSDVPSTTLDLARTLLSAVGSSEVDDPVLDGRDLLDHWTRGVAVPDAPLFWRQRGARGQRAVRLGPWKLLHEDPDDAPQLFDLRADLGEEQDLAEEHPERVAELTQLLDDWETGLVQPLFGAVAK